MYVERARERERERRHEAGEDHRALLPGEVRNPGGIADRL
jgi:hypothetical protein